MKISITDAYLRKFTGDMEAWWIAQGHEVRMDRYWNPENAIWADVIWIDVADNNVVSATNPGSAIMDDAANFQPWDLHDMDLVGKKVIVRAIDIEIWTGIHLQALWDVITDVIFIAPHIKEIAGGLPGLRPDAKVHVIPCSVNLDRYRYAERAPGLNIGIVSEKWTSKGTDLILQIALKLKKSTYKKYKFSWLGRWSDHPWEVKYFEDFIKEYELNFEFVEWIEGNNAVDEFLEDKNYLLHASHKEAFSYATAEAMAKGIKPVVHRFYGADDLWPGLTWASIDDALYQITNDEYLSPLYRQYLINEGYTVPQMMEKIDKVIKGE